MREKKSVTSPSARRVGVGVESAGANYRVIYAMSDGTTEPAGPDESYVSAINRSRGVLDKMLLSVSKKASTAQ